MELKINENEERFYVGESTIPGIGKGLFAKVPLLAGDRLPVLGVLIPADSPSDACTHYADRHKFRIGDQLLIPVGFAAMVNHSACPNMEKIIEGESIHLRVLREVSPGEELFFTYSREARERLHIQ